MVALGVHVFPGYEVPQSEQLMSVVAAATSLSNAIHMAGFGAIWLTGASTCDLAVRAALGLAAADTLAGFLFVGTPVEPPHPARRPPLPNHVAE